ncbi:GtrA family protein [Chelativorans salis]|uniref:GtrA family protein n=1 Tax=Chelativorans salis TaxID=2978478 RepID=A0ABT2LQW7_9HYPH|nr:GtrA family protein [Chelativorans sp. EGI FJ00035]MCT7376946.1 GtrA family protein [Chelativorans sp. EGI FJ00035]
MPRPYSAVWIESLERSIVTAARFTVVGAITTTLDVVLFTSLVLMSFAPALANVFSYSAGILASYHLNRSWTFRADRSSAQAIKFCVSNLAGLLLSTILITFLATLIPAPAAKIVSVPMVFVWNYVVARLWVFQSE